MFGANAFGWAYYGQAYAGTTSAPPFVDGPFLSLRVGAPESDWSADAPRSAWRTGDPFTGWRTGRLA